MIARELKMQFWIREVNSFNTFPRAFVFIVNVKKKESWSTASKIYSMKVNALDFLCLNFKDPFVTFRRILLPKKEPRMLDRLSFFLKQWANKDVIQVVVVMVKGLQDKIKDIFTNCMPACVDSDHDCSDNEEWLKRGSSSY